MTNPGDGDELRITALAVTARIGVLEWERTVLQPLRIDICCPVDVRRASAGDALADALDYADLCASVQTWVADSHFYLIETLAEHLAQRILHKTACPWVALTVHKPQAVPEACDIAIRIFRTADSLAAGLPEKE